MVTGGGQPALVRRFSRFAWTTLVVNLAVILWGAYVRATGSGAGCGGHWPLCNGLVIPRQPALETVIEYTHRFSSGIALVLVAGMLYLAMRIFPRGHRVRRAASVAGALIIVEALLGAGLVIFELVAGNTSVARAVVGSAHLLNTFLLLASVSLAGAWSTWEPSPILRPMPRGTVFWLGVGLIGVLFIGMTGSIAALGDTLFPSMSLSEGFRQDLDQGSHFLLRLRGFHPVVAVVISFLLVGLARLQASVRGSLARVSNVLIGFTVIQLLAGALNVFLLAPIWLQLLHLLLADGLWITLVLFSDRSLRGEIGLEAQVSDG